MSAPEPTLEEGDVSAWVGATSYERGVGYHRDRTIEDARREGATLRARCRGSYQDHYYVSATLGDGVLEAACDCPVGDDGRCKHVAALLLTQLRRPEDVLEVEPMETVLEGRSREQLVALVRQMVARHPDLRDLVTMPVPGEGALDAAAAERQVRRAFSGDLYEWGSAYRIGRELERVVRQGEGYVRAEDWASVVTLCDVLLDGIVGHYDQLHDENGDLGDVVETCVEHLGQCLEHAADAAVRLEAARLLADAILWDVALGGIGMGDGAGPVLEAHATRAERDAVGARVEAELTRLEGRDEWGSKWRRKTLGQILTGLLPDDAGDDAHLRVARASGRTADLVGRLLALDRLDDALGAVRAAPDLDVLEAAPLFLEAGHTDALDALALERLGDDTDRRLVEWIKGRARDRGDGDLAHDLAERLFRDRPSLDRYVEVLAFSAVLGREDEARAALRGRLRAQKAYPLLTEALLHDGDLEGALALMRLPHKEWPWPGPRTRLRPVVAKSLEDERPDDAAGLYLDAATDLVDQRNRPSYAEAARLLAAARAVYRRQGKAGEWELLIGEVREATKTLRAFRDELRKAGL